MTTLEAVLGRRPGFDETMHALAEGFRREHGLALAPGGLTGAEVERAEALVREKYATERWTRAGRAMTARAVVVPGGAESEGKR
jgi:lipoate-protein ligase A